VKPLVYIAGPYTAPDPVTNTRKAISAGMSIYDTGLAIVEIPHLTLFVHFLDPRPVHDWYMFDYDKLEHCNALYRLGGKSSGADNEVRLALRLELPVFCEEDGDMHRLLAWCKGWQP
jgi:hypothetical protein